MCCTLGSDTSFPWANIPICRAHKASLRTAGAYRCWRSSGTCSPAVRPHCLFSLFVPAVPFSGPTYPALSQYQFHDFAAGKRRIKLYPLWLHIEFCFMLTLKSGSLRWCLVTGKCLFLPSQQGKQCRVLRSAPETHPVPRTWQVLTQQPNHHSTQCTDSAHPKHHTKEVQASLHTHLFWLLATGELREHIQEHWSPQETLHNSAVLQVL